jgi:hypothetical protein
VEPEDVSEGFQEGEAESAANPWLGSACDKKLDQWRLLDESTQDGEDGRGWLIIDALIQRIDNNDTWDVSLGKWFHKEAFELSDKGGVSYGWVLLDGVDDAVSKVGITT